MTTLNDIISVSISAATASASARGFGKGMYVADHTFFTERTRSYTSMVSVASDIPTSSVIYNAATRYFQQSPRPQYLKIGRIQVDDLTFTVESVENSTDYTVTVNGTDYTYTSDATATVNEITAGLQALLDVISGFTCTDNADGTFDLIGTDDVAYTATVGDATLLSYETKTLGETWTEGLNAINIYDNDWYRFGISSRTQADQLAAGTWAQSATPAREFFTADDDTVIINTVLGSDTTSLAVLLKNLSYTRSNVIYSSKADGTLATDEWPEMAVMSYGGSNDLDIESFSYCYKQLIGVTAETLTPTQETNVKAKYCNWVSEISGNTVYQQGTTAEGEWTDVIEGTDWVTARIQEDVFNILLNNKKVPYDDGGIQAIVGACRKRLIDGIGTGLFTFDTALSKPFGVYCEGPDAADVSSATKATRHLSGVEFRATLAGAIHTVAFTGTIST